MKVFARAGPAEVLRSSQKDDAIITALQKKIEDAVLTFGGARFSMLYKQHILSLSNLIYYFGTTLSGLQTLGEEYTGIVQVDKTLRHMPNFLVRFIMILLESFGMTITCKLCASAEDYLNNNNELLPEAKVKLLNYLSIFKSFLPYINNFHKAIFFCNWGTYHLSKRITGVHYIIARFWLKDRQSLPAFRILGGITILQLIVTLIVALKKKQNTNLPTAESQLNVIDRSSSTLDNTKKCAMCLSVYQQPTCTPCGHIFCWNCILEWLQTEDQCPICREPVKSSRVVPLQNYI